ncbi:Gldg family protein, partial [bacterium]|nr:Gldg family protein [bacterium]
NLLLDEYASHSPQVQFVRLDPHTDPDARERFEEELDMNLHADTVTFDGSSGRRVVPLGSLIATSPAGNEPETFRGEEVFSSTLQALAEGSATVVGFVTGHGERLTEDFGERTGLSIIVELLEGDNCTVRDIVLPEVPEDCNMLVVAGPRRPFLPQELAALQRWLRDGRGGLILLLDPVGPAGQASGLEPLLQSQGIRAATDLTIVQMTRGFRGAVPRAQVVTTQHGPGGAQQHPVTEEMRGLRTAYDKACPVLSVERGRKGDPVIELVRTSADAWAKAGLDPTDPTRLRPDPARDKRGPFPLAVAREGENGGRMVVVGDSDFVTNRFLRQGALGNATLFRNAVAWAAGKEYKVGIAATRFGKVDGIDNLTRSKRALTWWATVFAPPFHIVLIGLIVWWARRR